jgi:hypothetical protein
VMLRAGLRLKSGDGAVEVVVVAGQGDQDVRCNGAPMIDIGDPNDGSAPAGGAGDVLVGKRYTAGDGSVELLCTRGGAGVLTLGGEPFGIKDAKPLPSSD